MSLLLNIAYSKQCCFIWVKPLVLGIITPCENNRHIGTSAPFHTYSASVMRIALCVMSSREVKKANDLSEKSEVGSAFLIWTTPETMMMDQWNLEQITKLLNTNIEQ